MPDVAVLLILTGPPGAGKSTIGGRVARRHSRAVHLHTDDFWAYIVAGSIPPYEAAASEQNQTVMRVIAEASFGYARGGYFTVLDGIVGPWMLRHFRRLSTAQPEVDLVYIVLRPRRQVALARAQARTTQGALLSQGPIGHMWDQFADLGPLESHVLDTSDDDTGATERRVQAALRNESMRLLL